MKSRLLVLLVVIYSLTCGNEAYAQYSRSITASKTYTTNGTFTITDLNDIPGFDPNNEIFALAEVDVLLVGGGGGGGSGISAGGGGGGQVRFQTITLALGATLNISIGSGGSGATLGSSSTGLPTSVNLTSGTFSSSYTAAGGRGGANSEAGGASGNGNSGGIGDGSGQNAKGGGGGGSASPGTNGSGSGSSSTGGNGGDGTFVAFTGKRFGAGGGGNGRYGGSAGSGGTGNANPSGQGGNPSPNTGSGGGAGIIGSKGSDGIVIVQISYRILPVEFLYFKTAYKLADHTAILEWKTAKEWENSHFEIERAVNSVKTWETIGRVEGTGYSDMPVAYHYKDIDLPKSGGNVFYRIKQVDYSGSFSYSVTRSIQAPSLFDNDRAWIAYPNPSAKGTEVQVEFIQPELYQDQTIYITLSNLLGQTKSYSSSSPEEISSIVSAWLNASASGLYILDIAWGNQGQQVKLMRN